MSVVVFFLFFILQGLEGISILVRKFKLSFTLVFQEVALFLAYKRVFAWAIRHPSLWRIFISFGYSLNLCVTEQMFSSLRTSSLPILSQGYMTQKHLRSLDLIYISLHSYQFLRPTQHNTNCNNSVKC